MNASVFDHAPRKAGQQIPCVNCGGHGYVLRGWGERYPVECGACTGSGKQTIRKQVGW